MDLSNYGGLGVALYAAGVAGAWLYLRGRATPPYQEQFQRPVATVSKLYLYPVKSCHRVEVDSIECWKRGLKYDRTFVVVDSTGKFLSQRAYPTMAQILPHLELGSEGQALSLCLSAPDMEDIEVAVPSDDCKPTTVVDVWSAKGEGVDMGDQLGAWLSRFLDLQDLRVYYMSPRHKARDPTTHCSFGSMAEDGDESSFSDFAPLLILSEASMELLNTKLKEPLEIERFRPNIIVKDCPAHAEDDWPELRIGNQLVLRYIKPCGRCKMTTVHQEEGQFSRGEPLTTLWRYRSNAMISQFKEDQRLSSSPLFASNYKVTKGGTISVNDTVYIR